MRYEMTVTNDVDMTPEQQEEIIDVFGEDFDYVFCNPNMREVEAEGFIPNTLRGRLAEIVSAIRAILGWPQVRVNTFG